MKSIISIVFVAIAVVPFTVRSAPQAPTPIFSFQTGGSGNYGVAMAVDAQGNTYVVGSTYQGTSFPVTDNAVQKNRRSMFVAKIAATGDRLIWATYLGGTHNRNAYWRGPLDYPTSIAVDAEGNTVVTGSTAADDFPVMNPVVSPVQGQGNDGFLTKLSADGSRILFSTYLNAYPISTATDFAGSTYVGMTADRNVPYQTADLGFGAGGGAIIAKFNPVGSPMFATHVGGPNTTVKSIAVDGTSAIVVTGASTSDELPLVNPLSTKCWTSSTRLCRNPFVARLSVNGRSLVFSTFVGGSTQVSTITSLTLDPNGAIYVTGSTKASDFPLQQPSQTALAGAADYFLTKITTNGVLAASTYLGSETDNASGTSVPIVLSDLTSRITLIGATNSRTGIVPGMDHPDVPLYVSHDDGVSWSPSASGLKASVFTIATSPRDRTWYAGTGDGVYRSIDNGESWTKSSAGINPNYAGYIDTYQIAIDPAHPGTAYAGTLSGTYKSEDRGSTWTLVDSQTFFPGLTTQAQLVVDGNGWVYLGTAGVRRSQDGGKTWTTISDGFVKGPTGVYEQLDTIVFDPNIEATIYAIQNEVMYRSVDGGQTWTALPSVRVDGYPIAIVNFYGLALPVGRRGRIFASGWQQMLRSDEAGATWQQLAPPIYRARFVSDPRRPDTLFSFDGWVGTPSLLVTHDGGDTWQALRTPTSSKAGVIFDLIRPATLFAPGNVRSLPVLLQFDSTVSRSTYATFLDMSIPTAAAIDPSGALYWLSSGTTQGVVVTKLLAIHTLNPSSRPTFPNR